MISFLCWVLLGWAGWAALCLTFFVLYAWLVEPTHPEYNGFRVRIPAHWRAMLTPHELHAVIEHELGHARHHHPWWNLLRACCFVPYTATRRVKQELQADDCVSEPAELARALTRLSRHPFDLYRACRLTRRAVRQLEGQQEAGTLALGMSAPPQEGVRT